MYVAISYDYIILVKRKENILTLGYFPWQFTAFPPYAFDPFPP